MVNVLAVSDLTNFVRDRWAILGNSGGLAAITEAGGPDVNTIKKYCQDPHLPMERETDKRRVIAQLLRFQSWEDLIDASQRHPPDLTRHAVVSLEPAVYAAAVREAAAKKMSLNRWITWAITRAAENR